MRHYRSLEENNLILFLEELFSVFDHCREPTTNFGVNVLSFG